MWRWIAKEKRKNRRVGVVTLKTRWVKKNGFGEDEIAANCFFCEYDESCQRNIECCEDCPARKIDKHFICGHPNYRYNTKPVAFYNKLVSLNRKRLNRRKK